MQQIDKLVPQYWLWSLVKAVLDVNSRTMLLVLMQTLIAIILGWWCSFQSAWWLPHIDIWPTMNNKNSIYLQFEGGWIYGRKADSWHRGYKL